MTEDVPAIDGESVAHAAFRGDLRALFVPTMVVALGYLCMWFFLYVTGNGSGAMARLSIAVLALGVPVLIAHAGLRYVTISIVVGPDHIVAHRGFPIRDEVEISYRAIREVRVRRGISGSLTGAGTILIDRVGGKITVVPDIANPRGARKAILEAKRISDKSNTVETV